jgi:plasmid stabilization system protein ParE
MTVIYTDQSLDSLEDSLYYLIHEQGIPTEKVITIRTELFNRADGLSKNPYIGQLEEHLQHLNEGHRRLIEGHFKIIYKIEVSNIYITDFFDTRQSPDKMKG